MPGPSSGCSSAGASEAESGTGRRREPTYGDVHPVPDAIRILRVTDPPGKVEAEWLAYPEPFRGGVRVACRDLDGDGRPEVICAPGSGLPSVPLRVFGGRDRKVLAERPTFTNFEGGGFVGGR